MFTLTKWIAAPVAAIGLMFAGDSQTAEAQYGCYPGGGLSISIGSGRYGYRPSFDLYRSSYGHGHLGRYHSRYRGHWDYHPTEIYRHGNHFHVQPGHYDWHAGRHHHHHYRH